MQNVDATGIYVPVNRGTQLINFVLMAVTSALASTIASLYAAGNRQKLRVYHCQSFPFVNITYRSTNDNLGRLVILTTYKIFLSAYNLPILYQTYLTYYIKS